MDPGGRTISDYAGNGIGKLTFPVLQKLFKDQAAYQFVLQKIINEYGGQTGGQVAEDLTKLIWAVLEKQLSYEQTSVKSPVEPRVYDSTGNVTGI